MSPEFDSQGEWKSSKSRKEIFSYETRQKTSSQDKGEGQDDSHYKHIVPDVCAVDWLAGIFESITKHADYSNEYWNGWRHH